MTRAFVVCVAWCIGCGGAIASGDDASTTSDAGAKDVSSDSTSIPDAGFTSSLAFENVNGQGSFFGAFYANAQQANAGCQSTAMGSCTVFMCPSSGPQTLPSAGTLTLTVGSTTSTVTQNAQNGFYMASPLTFASGDSLGVAASGGDVPAFGTHTITSPGNVVVSPALPTTVSTSQDLTLTWSGGEPGASVIIALARQGFNAMQSMSCNFDATAGTGTIPKAQLGSFQSGSPSGDLMIGQQRMTTFTSGTFVINLVALQSQDQPVTFQ